MPPCEIAELDGLQHREMFHSNEIFHGIQDVKQIKGTLLWLRQGFIQGSFQSNSSSRVDKRPQGSLEQSDLTQIPFSE